jgi:NADH:ubiquinone oxidoreductase subunit E
MSLIPPLRNPAVEEILAGYANAGRDALIPILQEVQEKEGYISVSAVKLIGRHLHLPASKIFGVATFYNQFRFQALGEFHIQVCRGTACHVKESATLLEVVCEVLKIKPGNTTRDGRFSVEVVACMGACGLAPLIRVNDEFHASVTPLKVEKLLRTLREEKRIHEAA